MPTFDDPLADGDEARQALHTLAHAMRSFATPAHTNEMIGERSAGWSSCFSKSPLRTRARRSRVAPQSCRQDGPLRPRQVPNSCRSAAAKKAPLARPALHDATGGCCPTVGGDAPRGARFAAVCSACRCGSCWICRVRRGVPLGVASGKVAAHVRPPWDDRNAGRKGPRRSGDRLLCTATSRSPRGTRSCDRG